MDNPVWSLGYGFDSRETGDRPCTKSQSGDHYTDDGNHANRNLGLAPLCWLSPPSFLPSLLLSILLSGDDMLQYERPRPSALRDTWES